MQICFTKQNTDINTYLLLNDVFVLGSTVTNRVGKRFKFKSANACFACIKSW